MTPDEFVKRFEENTGFIVIQIQWMRWGKMFSLQYVDPKEKDYIPFLLRKNMKVNITLVDDDEEDVDNPYTEKTLADILWQVNSIVSSGVV